MRGAGGGGGDQEVRQKHPCKLCSRSFPCGRSLGGHMRGHMASSSGSSLAAAATAPSLSASEIRKELEDVALCLMMLSRDVGCWGGFHSIAAPSDGDSAVPEEVEASTTIGDLNRICVPDGKEKKNKIVPCVEGLGESDGSRDPAKRPRLRRALADLGNTNSKLERCHLLAGEKSEACKPASGRDHGRICDGGSAKPPHGKSSFECTTCGKAFGSYQALGGHQTSHNRAAKSCLAPKPDGGRENSVETAISTAAEEETVHQAVGFAEEASSRSQKKANHHECGICFKVFPSGQALGGHKRRHFSGNFGGPSASCRPTVAVQEQLSVEPRVFDLNLPAPAAAAAAAAAGDSSAGGGQLGFRSWWVGSDHQGEPLVHLVSS